MSWKIDKDDGNGILGEVDGDDDNDEKDRFAFDLRLTAAITDDGSGRVGLEGVNGDAGKEEGNDRDTMFRDTAIEQGV